MFENFPYTDMHQLNLDWIVKIAKDFLDQYTHIQQLISDGEDSLQNITSEGLQQLQDKADNLEGLLQQWYDTHSQDIADQLANALQDLNEWYTTHQGYLNDYLQNSITAFNTAAEAKAAETIASIPDDYTQLSDDFRSMELAINQAENETNLFDRSTAMQDKALNVSTGTVYNANGYWTSEFIEVHPNFTIAGFSNESPARLINFICTYDEDQTFIETFTDYIGTFTIPSGVKYIRICNGASAKPSNTYSLYYIADKDYDALTALFCESHNLFLSNNIQNNKAINVTTGVVYDATGYYTSDYIRVYPGHTVHGFVNNMPRFPLIVGLYGRYYNYIGCLNDRGKEYTIPEDVYYVRFTNSTSGFPPASFSFRCVKPIDYMTLANETLNGYKMISGYCIRNDGSLYQTQSMYSASEMIPVSYIAGKTLHSVACYPSVQINPIAFYDKNKQIIGSAYAPSGVTGEQAVTFTITPDLLSQYPDAVYCRIGMKDGFHGSIVDTVEEEMLINDYPSYKINMFPKIFFGGDSVTEGFVVEGTEQNPQTIYRVMTDQSYPACFNRIYAKADVTVVAQSGITPIDYLANKYPNIDFSEYNLIIIELGLNGGLDIADIDAANTNTNALKTLIAGIRSQNSDATICLVRSQHYLAYQYQLSVFTTICTAYDCVFVDLHNTKYLDLDDEKYHGYYDDSGTPALDYAHFTRMGYAAKAYVVARLLADEL